ncbi:hypothetical protein EAI_03562 [Harpegnathos saltator]|uniref:Uncharacterized protein n=1 Tax=Harpegnathos saltator TaxID=610380 RepID=E2C961_HARSA|nr:hypothetical protein EAI_03562 [Harpegnathos saltator]
MVKFIARSPVGKDFLRERDCSANRNSHAEISRSRAETNVDEANEEEEDENEEEEEKQEEEEKEEEVPPRSLSQKLAKEDGESFHLRAAAEVGANGDLKSFAIERRRFFPLLVRRLTGSWPTEEQPVDPMMRNRRTIAVDAEEFSRIHQSD